MAADAGAARAAFDAGATILTHAFNAMRGIHHRAPGPVVAALRDERVTLELIADGVHVHPDVVSLAFAAAPSRIALITDAMAAAGLPALPAQEVDFVDAAEDVDLSSLGDTRLGGMAVEVVDPVVEIITAAVEAPPFDLYRPEVKAGLPTQLDHAAVGQELRQPQAPRPQPGARAAAQRRAE